LPRYIAGLWSGYRAAWIFIGAAIWLWPRRVGWQWGALFAIVVLGTAVGGLFIAADMSRTLMMISPVLLLGIWLAVLAAPALPVWLLPAVVFTNFVLPATHEIWFMTVDISRFPTEFARWQGPTPPVLAAAELLEQAVVLKDQGKFAEARSKLDEAIRTDDAYAVAYARRAALKIHDSDFAGALSDVEAALRIDPTMPYALFLRGLLRAACGDRAAAVQDIRQALQNTGPDWAMRSQAEQVLKQLTEQGAPPEARPDP